ncbi:MAG TPA: hypothetical protein VLB84_19270 [Bacteroidia bacterium]|nr:hypothetical protein [Bacteroidia bacterium]
MNDQSKGMKILYTVFLIAVTIRTCVSLYDRLTEADKKECDCKNKLK